MAAQKDTNSIDLMDLDDNVPKSYLCPINQTIMTDPYFGPDGHSYQKEAIITWLTSHTTSPLNPACQMTIQQLVPNHALRNAIEEWKQQTQQIQQTQPIQQTNLQVPGKTLPSRLTVLPPLTSVSHHLEDLQVSVSNDQVRTIHISVIPPSPLKPSERLPCDLVCVIDISGSMGDEAVMMTGDGKKETYGLSILDVVKHAVRTTAETLNENDRLALVVFSTEARTIFDLTDMNDMGKNTAKTNLEKLNPENTTNIWGGLKLGMDLLNKSDHTNRNCALMLFTDGQPNVTPPRGEVAMLQDYIKTNGIKYPIHTFGFGYSLDTQLLLNLSYNGNGQYCYIPDSSLLGSILINAISNTLATAANNLVLTVKPKTSMTITGFSAYPSKRVDNNIIFELGSIQFGQSKDLILEVNTMGEVEVSLEYISGNNNKSLKTTQNNLVTEESLLSQKMRVLAVANLIETLRLMRENNISIGQANNMLITLISQIRNCPISGSNEYIKQLLLDLTGQVSIALSKPEYFQKWGRHYLPSLVGAHHLQICNNFKDPGVQLFGGKLFHNLRSLADDVFNGLPPPKPSRQSYSSSSSSYKPIRSMSVYNNVDNGCFDGLCQVLMSDFSTRPVQNIRKDDLVMTPDGMARVVCVIKMLCNNNLCEMTEFQNGLVITPWHPVQINNLWKFPAEIPNGSTYQRQCNAVYNFVLSNDHVMIVNGINCCTLGHNIDEDVVRHDYFGTEAVINDLKMIPGWNDGMITLTPASFKRNEETGLVSEITTVIN